MVGLMSGMFSLFREVFLINNPEKAKDAHLFWRCVFITFIISAVWLWGIEHQQTLDLRGRLEGLTSPKLTAEFAIALAPSGTAEENTVVTLSGLIKNQGAPSVLDNWSLDVELPSKTIHGNLITLPTPNQIVDMEDPNHKTVVYLSGAEHWLRTARQAPIPTGGGVQGCVNGLVRGITPEDLVTKKATIVLSFHDISGKSWVFRHMLGAYADPGKSFIKLEDVLSNDQKRK
jgi:hypothetical protein